MFKSNFFLVILCFCVFSTIAQKVTLKKELDAQDLIYLNQKAASCFGFSASMQISFNSSNLYNSKNTKGDKQAKLESIIELEKQLNGSAADADIYAAISGIYGRLKMNEQAETNRQKSINLYRSILEDHPDSVEAMYNLSAIYMAGSRFGDSKEILRKAIAIKPDYQDPYLFMPMLYMFGGQFDSIYPFIKEQIELHPDKHNSYVALPIYYFYNMYYNISQMENKTLISNLNTDSLMDMELLKSYYERDKKSFEREYLYRLSYETSFSTFMIFKTIADTAFDNKNIKFNVKGTDRQKLIELQSFFESCLKRKEIADKYLVNKTLGNIHLLLDEPKAAIPFFKKAIELKPLSKSKVMCNADEDYENLIVCNFILKDSTACEKILLEKIKINPAIDPNTLDYQHLGDYYASKKKYALAEQNYLQALKIDEKNVEAILGLGMLSMISGDTKTANSYINKAYGLDKDNWKIYCLSGIISLKEKDAKNAYEFFQISNKLSETKWLDEEITNLYLEVK